jgi:HAD superfamily hydrolase (TIGR01549 family)
MKKYRALVMDFDLTIADACEIIAECLVKTAAEFGVDTDLATMRAGIGCVPAIIYRDFAEVKDEVLAKRMEERYYENSYELNYHKVKFFPGVREGLMLLRGQGIKTAIFSQKERELIVAPLVREGMADLFDMIVSIDDVEKTKPDPEGIRLICRGLELEPTDILYTGDALTDQTCARAAGVDFVPVLCGATPKEVFDAGFSVGMYDSIFELCRAMTE